MTVPEILLLVSASAVAGAINSVAGGGTLLTFPALLAAGHASTIANATSTTALWPGQVSSLFGYRKEIRHNVRAIVPLLVIGLAGGAVGAYLLTVTSPALFDRIVPFLILGATALFMAQEPISRWQKSRRPPETDGKPVSPETPEKLHLTPGIVLFLLGISVYGGYFGAGIGILTLAALGLCGLTHIHQMNGIKNIFTLGINGIAIVLFITQGLVRWDTAGLMVVGSLVGGYAGAGIARRIGQKNVRRLVILIGIALSLSLLLKRF
ncbi:MAG: sulfite exporter TauE/SafE family protein [Capsulimonadales bacterium]|nr:sulfite exporter TauE/SafE family protein [Capsulimonadales bacterium]